MLRAGEKWLMCGVCENGRVVLIKDEVKPTQCARCGKATLRAVRVRPTNVSGAGRNATADLGLALLMEAGAGAPEEKSEFS